MEEWQRDHIEKNMVELIKNTTCNPIIISKLKSAKILAQSEEEELKTLSPMEQSKKLYEVLPTRVGSFDVLLSALEETRQTGALKILNGHNPKYQFHGLISIDKNHILGKGSFGSIVYKGTFGGRDIAVKVLSSIMIDLDKALQEVEFLKKLDEHENIVRYFFAEVTDNFIYIALEKFIINLQDEVKLKLIKMNPTDILRKCSLGLAHLHAHNVIHRDLKPGNILLNWLNQVKISDFGLSKQIPDGATSVSISGVVGTADWMAPEVLNAIFTEEVAQNQPIKMTTSSDIFSLGCIFYFVLTDGSHPFGIPGDREYHIRHDKPQLRHTLQNELWIDRINQMIASLPKERPSVFEILAEDFGIRNIQNPAELLVNKIEGHSQSAGVRRHSTTNSDEKEYTNEFHYRRSRSLIETPIMKPKIFADKNEVLMSTPETKIEPEDTNTYEKCSNVKRLVGVFNSWSNKTRPKRIQKSLSDSPTSFKTNTLEQKDDSRHLDYFQNTKPVVFSTEVSIVKRLVNIFNDLSVMYLESMKLKEEALMSKGLVQETIRA